MLTSNVALLSCACQCWITSFKTSFKKGQLSILALTGHVLLFFTVALLFFFIYVDCMYLLYDLNNLCYRPVILWTSGDCVWLEVLVEMVVDPF